MDRNLSNKEQKILNFYRMAIDHPKEFKAELDLLSINDKARLLAFIRVRDRELYEKIEKIAF